MGRPRHSPESLASSYLTHARRLFDAGRGRVRRRPAEDPETDPYFATLVACYTYAREGELVDGFSHLDIARNASLAREAIGCTPSRLVTPLRQATKRADIAAGLTSLHA